MAAPTPSRTRRPPRRALLVLVLALAALVLVAGCAGFDALSDLSGDLESEGFRDVTAQVSPTDASLVLVTADAPLGAEAAAARDQAAEIVWTRFPRRFERLRVTVDDARQEWTYAELEEQLGERPDSLDVSTDIGDELTRTYVIVILGVLAAGVVAVAVVGLIVFLAIRANRRNAAARPAVRPWMPPTIPGGGPVAPPGGWAPASAPPGPPDQTGHPAPWPAPGTPSATDPTGAPAPWAPPGPWTTPGPDPSAADPTTVAPAQDASAEPGTETETGPSLEKQPPDAPPPPPEPPTWASPPAGPASGTWASPPSGTWASPSAGPPSGTWASPPSGPTPAGSGAPPTPPIPPIAPATGGKRPKDPDARRLGRRPRGPLPDKAHTPPGWG